MKRALVLASVASMIDQFNMPNIRLMKEMDYQVDVACNFKEGSSCSDEKVMALIHTLETMGVNYYQIDFARNVLKVEQNLRAYCQTRMLVKNNQYDLIHSHSPIGGLLSRIATRDMRKKGTKVIYTAHGFHFFKGAPLKNWFIFYPIEKLASRWTDILITITHEDYRLAQEKMYAKKVVYVPGVGINTTVFNNSGNDYVRIRKAKREELGITDSDIMMISVGELNRNKNHEVVIRAMAAIGSQRLKYVIAGRGEMTENLKRLAKELSVDHQLLLLGFRTDVRDLFRAADVFVHPSFREGLSVAVMEAMASGLPVLCSNIRGNIDLIEEGKGGYLFDPGDAETVASAIAKTLGQKNLKTLGAYNRARAQKLDVEVVMRTMRELYK